MVYKACIPQRVRQKCSYCSYTRISSAMVKSLFRDSVSENRAQTAVCFWEIPDGKTQ